MLEVTDVAAGYKGKPVVSGVSAVVPRGGWLAIIGPNGAGKSTLLKAIAGLVPHTGTVMWDERPVQNLSAKERAKAFGYAPQVPLLPDGLSVSSYALLGRTPHLGTLAREGQQDFEVVHQVLERLDLTALASRKLRTLSGGERQRAVLARVLAQQTGILLLDEPTTGLDIGHAQALLDLVERLRSEDGTTVVSTLHDLTLAGQYADQLLLLDKGKVAAAGTPAAVLDADILARHYDARLSVLPGPDGSPVVVPHRRRSESQ